MTVKIKKLRENALTPFRATEHSAGADLFACLNSEIVLKPNEIRLIETGIALEIPNGYGGFVYARSSLASKSGITLANCVGVIDADYRGEVKIPLINLGGKDFIVKDGDRIAQLVIMPIEISEFVETSELSETTRGEGGFGSTDS